MGATILQQLEQESIARLSQKKVDDFAPGDTVRVNVKIIEGNNERIQAFEGVCIAKKNRGIDSSFTVRKISHGEGVERVFPLYSPRVDSVELIRRGNVRRAKLYYLRELTGKAARITEKMEFVADTAEQTEAKAEKAAAKTEAKAVKKAARVEKAETKSKAKAEKKTKAEK